MKITKEGTITITPEGRVEAMGFIVEGELGDFVAEVDSRVLLAAARITIARMAGAANVAVEDLTLATQDTGSKN